jgi:acyl-CoA synthetase (AMP-forming)/AMP-acid ligase II
MQTKFGDELDDWTETFAHASANLLLRNRTFYLGTFLGCLRVETIRAAMFYISSASFVANLFGCLKFVH